MDVSFAYGSDLGDEPAFLPGWQHAPSLKYSDDQARDAQGRWESAGGSSTYSATIEPHPFQEGKVRVGISGGNGVMSSSDSRTVEPGHEDEAMRSLASSYNDQRIGEVAQRQADARTASASKTPEQVQRELANADAQVRDMDVGYSKVSDALDRSDVQSMLTEAMSDPWGKGTYGVPSASEVSLSISALQHLSATMR